MERRSFIGTIIGVAVGKPFIAEPVITRLKPLPQLECIKRWIRAFELTESKLRKFRGIVKSTDGDFWAPSLNNMEIVKTELSIVFKFNDVKIHNQITAVGLKIVDDQGYLLADQKYVCSATFNPGDLLQTSYTLSVGLFNPYKGAE